MSAALKEQDNLSILAGEATREYEFFIKGDILFRRGLAGLLFEWMRI